MEALDGVESLDFDRILRNQLGVDRRDACGPTCSSRAATRSASSCDRPRSPRSHSPPAVRDLRLLAGLEGIHLRGGKVARGGIRWSDRMRLPHRGLRPDAAPDGQERRHRPRRAPKAASSSSSRRATAVALRDEVEREYVHVHRGAARRHRQPRRTGGRAARGRARSTRRHLPGRGGRQGHRDLSDTANPVAVEYGFWLGDAFASGGSTGYDHKDLGITARGAWESVKRHFRELGVDVSASRSRSPASATCRATCSATACCCRRTLRLVAAFDHRHIFVDPDPDPARSFAERAAAVRAARLLVGRLRPRGDLGGRRGLRRDRQAHRALAAGARARWASRPTRRSRRPRSSARSCARPSTCSGTAASARS